MNTTTLREAVCSDTCSCALKRADDDAPSGAGFWTRDRDIETDRDIDGRNGLAVTSPTGSNDCVVRAWCGDLGRLTFSATYRGLGGCPQ